MEIAEAPYESHQSRLENNEEVTKEEIWQIYISATLK